MMAVVIGQKEKRKEETGKGKKRKGKVGTMVDPTWRLRFFDPCGGIDRLPSCYWAAPPPDHVRAGSEDPAFSKFICPLSGFIMQDPVRTSDGETYDRLAIEFWFQKHDTNPITGAQLPDKRLHPLPHLLPEYQRLRSKRWASWRAARSQRLRLLSSVSSVKCKCSSPRGIFRS